MVQNPSIERSRSDVLSYVSVKSDQSKGDGPNLREKKTSTTKSVRSVSQVFSSVSLKSDQSKGDGPNFSEKTPSPTKSVISGSHVFSSVSVKSDRSKGEPPKFSEKTPSSNRSVRSGSHVSSLVSMKSDRSKGEPPKFSEKTATVKRVQYEKSDFQNYRFIKNFRENLLWIFQDLENKIIIFLKNELERFKKIFKKENTQYFVQDFKEDMCEIKEAALDITLYFLKSMKHDELADTLKDELVFIHQRQLKSNLKKKYQCVFEGIAKHGDSTLLNSIYTDLYITQGGSEQINTEHEVRQIEVASRRHETQEIQVECTNLFEVLEQDKRIRTVLTKGVAGIGKSISVQKFILDWAEEKENQDISFIFPLPFREMNLKEKEKQSLMSLVSQFFPETKGLNLTRNDQFNVLFILDGLDECRLSLNFKENETWRDVSSPASLDVLLTNLIKGNLLPSAQIWITTRPAAASKIPPDCIDRVTEVRGFNDAQKEEYFRKRFTDENQAKEIIDHVKQSKSLFIMCHIPVFCWISATVLQKILEEKRYKDLKNSQADDASKTLQIYNTEDTPKTLTQMYTRKKEIVQYIKQKLEANLSPERSINLFYCLNELNDQTLVKEIQTHLNKGSLSSADLSPAQWSALAFVLLTSEEEMEEFNLQKFKKSDECLIRLSPVIKTSKKA
ncbi:NACHT, LRR and PYD domains-containing protein 4E-like, partial [Sinocyclocheilus rhinocerous]|uniref:NACHT, LRR and PYD domains-containing protein 4E-like n=1 Tax=Sinocyclocheilus rhinocerous TaxID=307959 RepID=UPI0007B7A0A4